MCGVVCVNVVYVCDVYVRVCVWCVV